jgi:hypothetical protein
MQRICFAQNQPVNSLGWFMTGTMARRIIYLQNRSIRLLRNSDFYEFRKFDANQSTGIQPIIAENVLKEYPLSDVSVGVDKSMVDTREMNIFEITSAWTIIMRGGGDGQVVILILEVSGKNVVWECIGGSTKAVTSECRK